MSRPLFKDAVLDRLARRANVAQFISFGPDLRQRFARVFGYSANQRFPDLPAAAAALLQSSGERSVNVRSFDPVTPKSREFVYGLKTVDEITRNVQRLAAAGLYTIANETIDVNDGGVSGVALGDVIEFAPGDTPRAVEKPGTAALPRKAALELLSTVYGFTPDVARYGPKARVEFSIHPLRRGFRQDHTVIWELETVGVARTRAEVRWPNRFSRYIGDKAFGLLIADLHGLPVPKTTVITRTIAPFTFGKSTTSGEVWIRTCPRVQVPGKYTTHRGWLDPFELMSKEDPDGTKLASVLAQEGVDATYSGAVLARGRQNGSRAAITIEGTQGFGDEFMIGRKKRTTLPKSVQARVRDLYDRAARELGPVRFEWVQDRAHTWIVQFHRGASPSNGRTIFPGKPSRFRPFHVENGLEPLRALIDELEGTNEGIVLIGDVGVTSHFGDVLRRAQVPSYIEANKDERDLRQNQHAVSSSL